MKLVAKGVPADSGTVLLVKKGGFSRKRENYERSAFG